MVGLSVPEPGAPPVARMKIAYIGGGSTRGAGTMASFIEQGENFAGSEIVLDRSRRRPARPRSAGWPSGWPRPRASTSPCGDDRPPRGPGGLRRDPDELPPRRLRGARARREDPAPPRRDRPGDAGAGRVLHGAALDRRDAGDPRGRRRGAAPAPGSSTTRTRSTSSPRRSPTTRDVPFVSLCEGPILYPESRGGGGARPGEARRRERRPQPRFLERAPPLRRPGPLPLLRAAWERRRRTTPS